MKAKPDPEDEREMAVAARLEQEEKQRLELERQFPKEDVWAGDVLPEPELKPVRIMRLGLFLSLYFK